MLLYLFVLLFCTGEGIEGAPIRDVLQARISEVALLDKIRFVKDPNFDKLPHTIFLLFVSCIVQLELN